MTKITQAFIFAAGRGERMRPLTDSIPKPLVAVNGKSIIDYSIEKLEKIPEIEKIIINGFYLAKQIKDHIKNLNNPKIIFSHENDKLETGGGLVFAQDKINLNQALLTINGDILWQESNDSSDIKKLCHEWKKQESQNIDMLLGLKKTTEYFGYDGNGDFNLKNGYLSRNNNKKMTHAFTGMQIINPKILKKAPQTCFSMSYFFNLALKTKNNDISSPKIRGIELDGRYFHIGTVDAIKKTEILL